MNLRVAGAPAGSAESTVARQSVSAVAGLEFRPWRCEVDQVRYRLTWNWRRRQRHCFYHVREDIEHLPLQLLHPRPLPRVVVPVARHFSTR